ncbi:MAG: hypothetical protein WDM81_06960 [Rhizomicrobium sp.]
MLGYKIVAKALMAIAEFLLHFAGFIERNVGWDRVDQFVRDLIDAASTGDAMRVRILAMSFAFEVVRSLVRF